VRTLRFVTLALVVGGVLLVTPVRRDLLAPSSAGDLVNAWSRHLDRNVPGDRKAGCPGATDRRGYFVTVKAVRPAEVYWSVRR
jgi:hypothetical protein